jgi:hypothetical protein
VRLVVAVALCLSVVTAAGAASSWRVRVNEGIAGVELDMTQPQVAARLGKPYAMSIAIEYVRCGMYRRVDDFSACFDTRTRRVVSTAGIGRAFCVVRPRFCLGTAGGVAKLKREFGRRLVGPVRNSDGDLFYEYVRTRGNRRVQNAFAVDMLSSPPYRGSAVVAVYIGYCARQGGYVPRCPRRHQNAAGRCYRGLRDHAEPPYDQASLR